MTMGYIIEITSEEKDELKDKAKKLLKYGKELYECIEELAEGSQMGERAYDRGGRYGNRGGSMGYRDDEDYNRDDDRMGERYPRDRWEEWPPYMGERRGRSSSTGRYVRR